MIKYLPITSTSIGQNLVTNFTCLITFFPFLFISSPMTDFAPFQKGN